MRYHKVSSHEPFVRPLAADSIHVEINSRVSRATRMIAAVLRAIGCQKHEIPEKVRAAVMDAFVASRQPHCEFFEVEGRLEPCTDLAGIYGLVLDHFKLNRANMKLRAEWLSLAAAELKKEEYSTLSITEDAGS